jgi:hypothetical protein
MERKGKQRIRTLQITLNVDRSSESQQRNNIWFSGPRQTLSLQTQANHNLGEGQTRHFSLYTRLLLLVLFWTFLELKNIKILLCKRSRNGSRLVFIVGLIEKLDIAFVKA